MTTLFDELFVSMYGCSNVDVYDLKSLDKKRFLSLGLCIGRDIVSSPVTKCLYILDRVIKKIDHSLKISCWSSNRNGNDVPESLAITPTTDIVVVYQKPLVLRIFNCNEVFMREVVVEAGIGNALHAAVLPTERYIVTRRGEGSTISMVGEDGFQGPVRHYTEHGTKLHVALPYHVVVDKKGYVLVADRAKDIILLLSPSLEFIRVLLSQKSGLRSPWRLYLNEEHGLLFVGQYRSIGGIVSIFRIKELDSY